MSHTTIVYPNGMVEVINDDEIEACDEFEAEDADLISDALDVLDEAFENHGGARVALDVLRAVHNDEVWAEARPNARED